MTRRQEEFYSDPVREARIRAHMLRVEREEAELNGGYIKDKRNNRVRDKVADLKMITEVLSDGVPKAAIDIMRVTGISEKVLRRYLSEEWQFVRVSGLGTSTSPWKYKLR